MRDLLFGVPDSGVVHGEHGGGQLLLGQALVWPLAAAAGGPEHDLTIPCKELARPRICTCNKAQAWTDWHK